jgi:hypothetical protein
MDRFYDK